MSETASPDEVNPGDVHWVVRGAPKTLDALKKCAENNGFIQDDQGQWRSCAEVLAERMASPERVAAVKQKQGSLQTLRILFFGPLFLALTGLQKPRGKVIGLVLILLLSLLVPPFFYLVVAVIGLFILVSLVRYFWEWWD